MGQNYSKSLILKHFKHSSLKNGFSNFQKYILAIFGAKIQTFEKNHSVSYSYKKLQKKMFQIFEFSRQKWANCTFENPNIYFFLKMDACNVEKWDFWVLLKQCDIVSNVLNCIIFNPYLKGKFLITHYTCLTYLPNAMCVFILNKWNFGIVDSNAFRIICELFAAIKNLLNFPCEWSYYPPNKQMVIAFFLTIAQFWILPYIWLFHSVWK